MKLVKEHINFQRGLDPKRAMGIGAAVNIVIDYGFITKAIVLNKLPDKYAFKHFETNDVYECKNIETSEIIYVIKFHKVVDNIWGVKVNKKTNKKLKESINFTRGIDPKQAMGTGIISELKSGTVLICKKDTVVRVRTSEESNTPSGLHKFVIDDGWYSVIKNIEIRDDMLELELATYDKYPKFLDPADLKFIGGEYLTISLKEFFEKFEIAKFEIDEAVNFKRGLDPKEAMDIGDKYTKLLKKMNPTYKHFLESEGVIEQYLHNFVSFTESTKPFKEDDLQQIILRPNFISGAFSWGVSPEGAEFWGKINTHYLRIYDDYYAKNT